MFVLWFDGDDVSDNSSFTTGRQLVEALIAEETRDKPHLIEFVDGWFTPLNWMLD